MPSPRPTVRRVLGYLRPHRLRFAGGLALTGLGILLDLVKPLPLALVLDVVLSGRPPGPRLAPLVGGLEPGALLALAALAIVLVSAGRGALTLAANYLTIDIGQRMVNDLRTDLYAHLQKLSLRFHYQQQSGDLLFRVMSDTFCIQSMVMNGLLPLVSAAATLGLMFWVMLSFDWQLAVVSLLVVPPLYLAIRHLSGRIHGHAAAARQAESELYSRAGSTIGAVKLVQAYGREQAAVDEFRRGSERSLALSLRLYSSESFFALAVETLLALGTAGLVWLGARHVLDGALTIGSLTIFLSYLRDMYQPIQSISHNLAELAASRAGLDRVFQVLDLEPDVADAPGARPLPPLRGELTLEDVTFGYGDAVVLDRVSLRVRPGERIALVGRTGAGKSTLAGLLLRFFDPQRGRVLLDGHDLREVTLRSLRQQVTLMLQEPVLFHSSVADNIGFGDATVSRERIQEAARRAEADGFIRELPQGYDTVLGEEGQTLSGGQRQRLALARALLRDTPIVLLDEPTSSLDLATEELVWRNVEALLKGKTALIIAHRLSTARLADRIVVLERGRIVEVGSHDELLARGGDYARLWQRHALTRTVAEDAIPATWD
ncbi:MAG: ABC transporter ATP-binding protein [Anaeromyxobacter sp.]|nr:ABC transporter ATP-binding protein [Anaeromyxobacter sp.]MBL0277435.1 ABC transporter ATP-binding protein [Anaeromyxobacter sp.]